MNLEGLGRALVTAAAVVFVIGLVFIVLGRLGFTKLPGDILWRRGSTRVFFPIVSGIVISLILTVLLNLFLWLWRR